MHKHFDNSVSNTLKFYFKSVKLIFILLWNIYCSYCKELPHIISILQFFSLAIFKPDSIGVVNFNYNGSFWKTNYFVREITTLTENTSRLTRLIYIVLLININPLTLNQKSFSTSSCALADSKRYPRHFSTPQST